MRLLVTCEHRFYRTPDGTVWTDSQCPYGFWRRYLEVFDHVDVLARVAFVEIAKSGWRESSGSHVNFECVPHYVGPWQYLRHRRQVRLAVRRAAERAEAILLRVGSNLAGCLEGYLIDSKRPYAVEVVSDPYDVFAPGAVRHPLRPFFRRHFTALQRRLCANAVAAAYVTKNALQRRYPCAGMQENVSDVEIAEAGAYSTHFSSIDLVDADYVGARRLVTPPYRLVTVGSLAQPYKGVDVLIDAIARCVSQAVDVTLTVIGDGQLRPALESHAREAGVSERVQFLGALPSGAPIREQLDAADVFVLASRTEGLPRAMIEAMARALPCIGSDVGGIPELLPASDLVRCGDAAGLAAKIIEVIATPGRLEQMSSRSSAVAADYHSTELHKRRLAFYTFFREIVERRSATTSGALGRPSGSHRPASPVIAKECRG
jgi:glycosyltransferase involved in cell wall biosynthesis